MREFIVAEVSKNWSRNGETAGPTAPLTDEPLLCQLFEEIINANNRRGYDLVTFQLHRVVYEPGELNETIVAVFRRRPTHQEEPDWVKGGGE